MNSNESLVDKFKELDDLEFEIIFVDNICKKFKSLDNQGIRSSTALFMYYSILESIRKYKQLAEEGNRVIPYEEAINLLLSKGDEFLSTVAENEERSMYVYRSLSDSYEIAKELMLVLKRELINTPKYKHLTQHTSSE